MDSRTVKVTFTMVPLLVLNLLVVGVVPASTSTEDIKILSSTSRSLTLEFTPLNWQVDSLTVKGELYQRLSFEGADFRSQAGEPLIPARVAVIGIPLNQGLTPTEAPIQYQILEFVYQEIPSIRLLPGPEIRVEDGFAWETYSPEAGIYSSSESYPGKLVEVEPPGYFRDQRIVRLIFFPLQYVPKNKLAHRYDRLVIKIDFIEAPDAPSPEGVGAEKDEDIYRATILNYHQARGWRKKHWPKLQKAPGIFSSEPWYKVRIRTEGMYKLDGNFLKAYNIDISTIDPKTIRLYNNGGRELPAELNKPRPDSLIENAIQVFDGGDGRFDASDYILFYGKSVTGWDYDAQSRHYSHYINHFTTENVYWLTWGGNTEGKRIEQVSFAVATEPRLKTTFRDHVFNEEELHNVLNSGLDWYGRNFHKAPPAEAEYTQFSFQLPDAIPEDSLFVTTRLIGLSAGRHRFRLSFNNQALQSISFNGSGGDDYLIATARTSQATGTNLIRDGMNYLRIDYTPEAEYSMAHVDWIELEFSRRLRLFQNYLFFNSMPHSGWVKFQISNPDGRKVEIFDITRFHEVKRIETLTMSDTALAFVDSVSETSPKTYLALDESAFLTPLGLQKKMPSDLRQPSLSADFIIVTPVEFHAQALTLKSLRQNWDSLPATVVLISDIYDEFAWGLPDPTAIRDFLKYAFDYGVIKPSYVLLFGDGHYDYKKISTSRPNWIPPHETTHLNQMYNSPSDDWFACVSGTDLIMDLAIGRVTAQTPAEAQVIVDKICQYETAPYMDDWRNTITIVADDELGQGGTGNETEHTDYAEKISQAIPGRFNLKKIYLTEYPAVSTASISGVTKPMAKKDLIEQINRGTAIVNFIGHGNEQVLAHERIFTLSENVSQLQNQDKLSFWVVASCAFGRYDDPNTQWISEELLTAEKTGAIAVFASARLALSQDNYILNSKFYQKLFPDSQSPLRLGEAIMLAKNDILATGNKEKYHLLGDPTLRLALPRHHCVITSVEPESIRALSKISVAGYIQSDVREGAKEPTRWESFNGKILLKVFDSRKNRTYVTQAGSSIQYLLPGNTIFRGTSPAQEGFFKASFIVPKDITYGGEQGRIGLYFWNDSTRLDGCGYREGLHVGGTAPGIIDVCGPDVVLKVKGQEFYSGCLVGPNPILQIEISDSISGINITGEIGHKITMTLDNDAERRIDLTEYFNYDEGSYLKGSIEYQLTGLTEGEHQIEVKAWDNFNNSAMASAEFTVVSDTKLILRNVLNYPNPFGSETNFTLEINKDATISVKIYTVAGRLIRTLEDLPAMAGFNTYPWDGYDQDGDPLANGVYLYKVTACREEGSKTLRDEVIQKLVVAR